jgi:orotidine-5'-phosphate decarboxylase
MFKPQHAHWEAIDGGLEALKMLIAHIHYKYPDIPVFLDCKRGDIDRTQAQYGHAHFELEGVDGMNYNGYMGRDTIEKLIDPDHPERALVGLGRTSNQSAWEIQDALMADGRALWEHVATSQLGWARDLCVLENAGLVMGAAHLKPLPEGKIDQDPRDPENINSAHLVRAREITGKDMWYLIPGIGTQGGFVEQTVRVTYTGPGSIAINNSSGINFASSGPDFAEAAGEKACKTRDLMNAAQAA